MEIFDDLVVNPLQSAVVGRLNGVGLEGKYPSLTVGTVSISISETFETNSCVIGDLVAVFVNAVIGGNRQVFSRGYRIVKL